MAEPKGSGNSSAAQAAARARREQEAEAEKAYKTELLRQVRAEAAELPRSEFDMRLIAKVTWAGVDWDDKEFLGEIYGCLDDELEARIDTMPRPSSASSCSTAPWCPS